MPKLKETMKILGYTPNEGGVCFGVAMMASQAIIRNQSHQFLSRINFIRNASDEYIESLAKPFDRKMNKKLHEQKVDLCCFFDELSIYQGNKSINEDFKSLVPSTQSVDNVKRLANAKKASRYVYPEIKQNIINLFSYHQFFDFILKVKEHLGSRSFSIILSHSPQNHATQIGFDAKQKKWFSSDHDYVVAGNDNIIDLEKVVDNVFLPNKYSTDNKFQMAVSLDIILSETKGSEEEIDLSPLKTNDFNIKKLTNSYDKKALSHLIICYETASRYDEMLAIFDKIKSFYLPEQENIQLLESKRTNGFTLFHSLAERNEGDVLRAFFKKAQEMKLSANAQISLLDAKDAKHPSLLLLALQHGAEKVTQVLMDAINTIEDENTRARLLGVKWSGIPALSIAAEKGYNKTMLALTRVIANIKDNKIKAQLLDAKDDQDIPALLIAIANEHVETSQILINAICEIKDNQIQATLLEAKDNDITSALLIATEKGQIEIVEMLTKAICAIKDNRLRTKILAAKDNKGNSALLIASEKGHIEIVEMLVKAICGIRDKIDRAKLLWARRNDGMSASLMAASNRHNKILQILTNAIFDIEKQPSDFF